MELEVKFQIHNLCEALIKNISNNLISVSFEILEYGYIQIKFVLNELSSEEIASIDDIMCEFTAMQQIDCVNRPIVEIGKSPPLKNIVYRVIE